MPRTCLCHAHLQTARYDVRRAEKEEEGVERREMKKNGVGGSRTFDLPPETGVLLESNWELGTPSRHLRLASPTRQAQKKVVVTEMRMARKGEKGKKRKKRIYSRSIEAANKKKRMAVVSVLTERRFWVAVAFWVRVLWYVCVRTLSGKQSSPVSSSRSSSADIASSKRLLFNFSSIAIEQPHCSRDTLCAGNPVLIAAAS